VTQRKIHKRLNTGGVFEVYEFGTEMKDIEKSTFLGTNWVKDTS